MGSLPPLFQNHKATTDSARASSLSRDSSYPPTATLIAFPITGIQQLDHRLPHTTMTKPRGETEERSEDVKHP